MKRILAVSVFLLSVSSFADNHAPAQGANFEEMKAAKLQALESRLQVLQDAKSCVSGASDMAALKKCREEARTRNKALKEAMKAKKGAMMEKMKQGRADKKKKKTE